MVETTTWWATDAFQPKSKLNEVGQTPAAGSGTRPTAVSATSAANIQSLFNETSMSDNLQLCSVHRDLSSAEVKEAFVRYLCPRNVNLGWSLAPPL